VSLRTSAALPLTQHNQTIVPWAAEQEVEEWEPAAGYEESTFPSLGLLQTPSLAEIFGVS